MDVPQPDEKSIITYVSSLYDAMPRVPEVQDGVRANVSRGDGGLGGWVSPTTATTATASPAAARPPAQELQLRWQEYYEVVTLLLQWVRQHILLFEERRFPASYEEVEVRRPPRCRRDLSRAAGPVAAGWARAAAESDRCRRHR